MAFGCNTLTRMPSPPHSSAATRASCVSAAFDAETGLLAHTGHLASVPTPVCLKMIRVL